MRSRGERDQLRGVAICLAVAAVSAVAILTGVRDMNALGYETSWTASRIGIGLFLLIMSLAMLIVFIWGYRVVQALASGRTRFQGWTVTPQDYARFRQVDANLGPNDYRALTVAPAAGVDLAFSRDGLLIDGRYFGLVSTGLQRFVSVAAILDPPMLEFGIVTTMMNRFGGSRRFPSTLRVPVASDAGPAAAAVLAHYQAVLRCETIVHPNFWKARFRGGLVVAALSAACATVGGLLLDRNAALNDAPEIVMIVGVLFGLGGLFVAGAAWTMDRSRRRR